MDKLEIGYVARAHGVHGELRIVLHDPTSTALEHVSRVWFGGVERTIRSLRPTQGAWLVCVEGVADREAAEAMKGNTIDVLRRDLPLKVGEFFVADLVGCDVVDEHGNSLGQIAEVWHAAQDILVIRDQVAERLLPLVPAFVAEVDLVARRVKVTPPEDLPMERLARRR